MKDVEIAVPWSMKDVLLALSLLVALMLPGFLLSFLPFGNGRLASSPNPLLSTFAMSLMEGTLVLLAWNFGIRRYHISFGRLGFRQFNILMSVFKGALFLIAIKVFTVLYSAVVTSLFNLQPPAELTQGIPDIFGSGISGLILAILVVAVIAPIAEETFFRGFVYQGLRKKFGVGAAISASAVVFALFHTRIWLIVPVIAMGAVLAFLYEQEDSLGPPIVLHSLNNLVSVLIIYGLKG